MRGAMIRGAILAAAAFGAFAAFSAVETAPAQARDYPFCIKGREYGSPLGDCSFDTYEQCQATASGRLDYCDTNPFYVGNPPPPVRPRRMPYPPRGY